MPFVYEFLYRGPMAANGNKPAWHVVLGNEVDDGFGGVNVLTAGPMTPTAAEARGYPISAIMREINAEIIAERDALLTDKATLESAKSTLEAENAAIKSELNETKAAKAALEAEKGGRGKP